MSRGVLSWGDIVRGGGDIVLIPLLILLRLCNPFSSNHKQRLNKPARQPYHAKFKLPI